MKIMSKMEKTIKELRNAAAVINNAADWLCKQASENISESSTVPVQELTPKKTLALEDIRPVLADKSREGFTDQIRDLLRKYGTDRLSKIDPKDYEALLKDVEALS
ncbi:MAG: DNA ligase [Eubacterium sp.]|nr:DNA ligase [Eubacterium sp.]MCH4078780.1 DNA ligase [Eubacterium sp.]